ncbi:hypothetical protein [Hymenobacter sp. BT491]|uniref:hypothetical protein n=1 Tax=Hymenobacter sp. BT491 TaxID=2766779 RepID=UPI001653A82F|nr:hypothetical protein [Hymenobacter sp. BT491]MBC6988763.1 hypothetical protein [Hymenobacter sp. BT491]
MSRIRMKIFVSNETDAALTFSDEEIVHGDFTPDWNPPPTIGPGERKGFQGEGNIVPIDQAVTGTEGRVRYQIEAPDGGELYIHWDSPLIESQFGNTFHVWAPANWEVTHSGGQGHEAELDIRLRRTARRSVPNFHARGRGFAFKNKWDSGLPVISLGFLWNALFDSLPGPLGELGIDRVIEENFVPITHADAGLCGGMVYTVMDYYAQHLFPPESTSSPVLRDDVLFGYIRDRLWDSFDVGGQGHRFLGYSSPHYPNGDEGVIQTAGFTRGRSWVTYREAFPEIQADIDAGRLSPVGLIQTDNLDIGTNHQVLAYAYEKSGQDVTLYIYDPNEAQQEIALKFNITATDGEVHVARIGGDPKNDHRIFCFFRINGYSPKSPPNGLRIKSVRKALRASGPPPYSVRGAVVANRAAGSVTRWLHTI